MTADRKNTPAFPRDNARAGCARPVPWRATSRRRIVFAGAALLVAALGVGGCSVANHAIRSDFTDFNNIIQFNQSQQMLLNLVRLHYRESPMFLQAGSLLASYSSVAGGDTSIGLDAGDLSRALGLNYEFASKPTITYTPIEGKAYVTQFMTEVSFETFCLLVRAGWPMTKLCEMLVEQIQIDPAMPLRNKRGLPGYENFISAVAMLQAAQEAGQLRVVNTNGELTVVAGTQTLTAHTFQLRSLFDVMFSASKSTETPPEHLARVKASKGNGDMVIHASRLPPTEAMVWVRYAGYYFSIDKTDLASKDTLALLMQLSRIQAAPSTGAPLLTLPAR